MSKRGVVLSWVSIFAVAGAGASTAVPAVTREPTGDFSAFKQCPRFTAGVSLCIYVKALGGEAVLGKRSIPLQAPIVVQGGIDVNEHTSPWTETFVGSLNGETLSRTPQSIPGGLFGRPLWMTLELVGPASEIRFSKDNFENREGAALSLRVRAHLEGPLLGGECYIGSYNKPLTVNLTTGATKPNPPNEPIFGKVGTLSARDAFNLLEATGDTLVDNAFAAPEATGCGSGGLSPLIDRLVDYAVGLPSPDGRNTLILNDTVKLATREGVIASEGG